MKGELGKFSKIEEEFIELKDADSIGNRIHIAHELSDIIGAIFLYAEGHDFNLHEILGHSLMKRAYFEGGGGK